MSEGLEPFRELMLFRFSLLNNEPKPFPVPLDIIEARSGLSFVPASFFRDPVENTSLSRVPGDTPRPSLD